MTVVDELEQWVKAKGLHLRPGARIMIAGRQLARLHDHWQSRNLPPVMTFMSIPMTVVNR